MDRHMPGMDGLQTTRKIRADSRFADLPIVAMTADVVGSAREECLRAGMNDFISKPFTPDSLFPVVARWAKTKAELPATRPQPLPATAQPNDGLLPATLPGLDIQEALALVWGTIGPCICGCCVPLPRHTQAPMGRIRILLIEGRLDDAIREAHTIKAWPVRWARRPCTDRPVDWRRRSGQPAPRWTQLCGPCGRAGAGDPRAGRVFEGDVRREPPFLRRKTRALWPGNETGDHAFP